MQGAAGKHDRSAGRRAIGAASELRKNQVAAFISAVQIEGNGEAAMLGAGIQIVAVAMKIAADLAVVAGDDIAVHARGFEPK